MNHAGTHDPLLVLLSVLIAVFASFTALNVAARLRASSGTRRRTWLVAASLTLGGGIWSMHFVGMLAFAMPGVAIGYDIALTALSFALAIIFTGIGFSTISRGRASPVRTLGAGTLMGLGVVAMHYVGMAAMRMDATLRYDPAWVAASIAIAIGAAVTAISLASRDRGLGRRALAAMVMGAAISGMHYAGMRGAIFSMHTVAGGAVPGAHLGQTSLAITIALFTGLVLLLALGAARIDAAFVRAARREARIALRLKIADVLRSADAHGSLQEMAAMMGRHFRVSRAGIGQLDLASDTVIFETCWTDGTVPVLAGTQDAATFGPQIVAQLSAGHTVMVEDMRAAPIAGEAATRELARTLETRAILVVPYVRDDRVRTIVYLNHRRSRQWQADDVRFMEELAERIRLVIERASVEDALRDLNATLEARVEARTAELRQAEAARREADMLYRAYFEHMPDPLFVIGVSPDGVFRVEQLNPAHEADVGLKLDDIRGRPIDEVLPPGDAARVIASYREVVATGRILQYRERLDLDARAQQWDTTLVPLTDADGRVVRIIGSSRNVTAQVHAEEALRQAQKMDALGQVTGGVAHDFNNLLTPIIGALDRLQRSGIGDERDRKYIEGALQSAERAKTLVQRLLSFARRQPLKTEPTDLSALVHGMSGLISSTIGPRIRVTIDIADDLPPAIADANQIEMALLNLSVNARDAMPEGGDLRIAARAVTIAADDALSLAPGAYLCLSVTDTGTGMDEATRLRAIDPFFSTKGVGRGTGLGLSMAHGLAAQLGGALTIESEPGRGTAIRLYLPQSEERRIEPRFAVIATPALAPGSVLLVDDDPLARGSTAEMLGELGYAVETACSGEQAIEILDRGGAFDLIVTDQLMPGMTGTELRQHVLSRQPQARILLISGYADQETLDPDMPWLAKPFLQAQLAARIAALTVAPGEGAEAGPRLAERPHPSAAAPH